MVKSSGLGSIGLKFITTKMISYYQEYPATYALSLSLTLRQESPIVLFDQSAVVLYSKASFKT